MLNLENRRKKKLVKSYKTKVLKVSSFTRTNIAFVICILSVANLLTLSFVYFFFHTFFQHLFLLLFYFPCFVISISIYGTQRSVARIEFPVATVPFFVAVVVVLVEGL